MTVKEAVEACEFISCDVVDFNGDVVDITEQNKNNIYSLSVEHISAKDNIVQIWTWINYPY